MNRYAIGDVHGCIESLKALMEDQLNWSLDDEVYFLGDYIDRGPGSKAVLDYLMEKQDLGYNCFPLIGNHDYMFAQAAKDPEGKDAKIYLKHYRSDSTLRSFGVNALKDIPKIYIDWIDALPKYLELADYWLVHAGFNGVHEQPLKDEHSMLFIRDWYGFKERSWLKGKKVLHGHTPVSKQSIELQLLAKDSIALNLDGGCVYQLFGKTGELVAFDLDEQKLYFQENIDTLI